MSSNAKSTGKWVSNRVLQQKQQQTPSGPAAGGAGGPGNGGSATGAATTGSKIMEDKAIAAARIKENQSNVGQEAEVPESKYFEVQEGIDALSNLAHNSEPVVYELFREATIKPLQTSEEFNTKLMEQLQKAK